VEQLYAALDRVTPEDVMRAAGKYFVPERRTMVALKGEGGGGKGERESEIQDLKSEIKNQKPAIHNPISSVLLPVADDPTVSFRIWFRSGSICDPPGKEGLAAITAAMIAEGATRSNSYEQILDKLFPLAADYSDSTTAEMTVISGRVHHDNLARFYPLLIEAVEQPAFKQEDLDRIKSQTLNYLQNTLRYSSDEELGKAVLYNTIFAGTPYGHLTAGTVGSVQGITLEDVKDFYRKHYTRENVVAGVGGGYRSAVLRELNNDLGKLPSGSPAAISRPAPAPIRGRLVTIVEKDCAATAISIGFPIDVLRGSREWYALAMANSWLGQHRNQNSHLYQVIREARGLNYGDYSYIEHFPGGSGLLEPPTNVCRRRQIFEMWIRPVPHSARHFALRAALRELKKLVDNGMTESEFNATRDFLRKYVLHLAPTTMDRLGYAIDDRFYGIKGSHLEDFRRMMDEVTLAEVNAAIKKHLQYENLKIVLVTKDAQSLKESLVGDAPSPITYPTPKPEAVLAEDREISVFPLKIKSEDVRMVPVTELFLK
jgi:zinc protease